MAYGLAVYGGDGTARVYDGSWLMRYHSSHYYNLGAGASKNVYISGFNSSDWILVLDLIAGTNGGTVSLHSGYVRLQSSSNYSCVFDFTVFRSG